MCRRYINFVDLLMVQMFLHWNLPFENIVLIFFDYFDQSIVWWLASKGSNISTSHYLRKHWLILLNATLQNMYGMLGRNINFWVLHPVLLTSISIFNQRCPMNLSMSIPNQTSVQMSWLRLMKDTFQLNTIPFEPFYGNMISIGYIWWTSCCIEA